MFGLGQAQLDAPAFLGRTLGSWAEALGAEGGAHERERDLGLRYQRG